MASLDGVIGCYNRCLYCGRRTPHEVCHRHSRFTGKTPSVYPSSRQNALWARWFDREPEVCEDPKCPQAEHDWQ